MYNKKLFELEGVWENYLPDEVLDKKSEIIFRYIPDDVQSIIDIGCGNGKITNKLNTRYKVMAVDSSSEALQYVSSSKILASAEQIPLKDASFDMAFSSELLEHLPDDILNKTILEMRRISRKYLLVTVPYNEFLKFHDIRCPVCNRIFHAFGHLHSFDQHILSNLLEDDVFKIKKWGIHGPLVKTYIPWLLRIRQKAGHQYYPTGKYTICPYCSNRDFNDPNRNMITKICNLLGKTFAGRHALWLFMLLSK